MKMNDLIDKPLAETLNSMDLVDFKVHSDDNGTIRSIEMKYVPKDSKDSADIQVPQFLAR